MFARKGFPAPTKIAYWGYTEFQKVVPQTVPISEAFKTAEYDTGLLGYLCLAMYGMFSEELQACIDYDLAIPDCEVDFLQ